MSSLTQTGALLKVTLKRDWLKISIWLVALVGIFVAVAAKFNQIYGTKSQIAVITGTLRSKAMVALMGPVTSGHLNTAIIFASEMMAFWGLFIIIFNDSLAVGATRGQEESGLTEMILGGHPVGRLAPLAAAALELLIADGLFVGLTGLGLSIAAMPGSDTVGNWLFAIILGAVGATFGMIALIFAQLVADSHNVIIYNSAFLGLAYLIRMVTDVQNPGATWFSPFGWIEKGQIYTSNNWLPVLLLVILGLAAFAVAIGLNLNRDIDVGLIHVRAGKRRSQFLRGPATLLFWNQRMVSLFWLLGMALLGASYGSVFNSIGKIVDQSPVVQQVLGQTGIRHMQTTQLLSFVSLLGVIYGVLAIVGGAMVVSQLGREERRGMLQLIQAKPQSRTYLLATYVIYGIVLSAAILFVALTATMVVGNAVLKQPLAATAFFKTFVATLPELALFISIVVMLIGILPRWQPISWALLGGAFILTYFGRLMDLPTWALKLSPFYWFRKVPQEAINVGPVLWMLGGAIVLMMIGFVGYRRRDVKNE